MSEEEVIPQKFYKGVLAIEGKLDRIIVLLNECSQLQELIIASCPEEEMLAVSGAGEGAV